MNVTDDTALGPIAFRGLPSAPYAFASPFPGEAFALLLWMFDDDVDAETESRLTEAFVAAGCRYAVCAGHDCESWHDSVDEAYIATAPDLDRPGEHLVTTSCHTDESVDDVAFFFSNCVSYDGFDGRRRVVLALGGTPADHAGLRRAVLAHAAAAADLEQASPLDDGDIILHPAKTTALLLLMTCSVFVAIGLWLGLTRGLTMGYVCAAFFGLGVPVAVIKLLPGSSSVCITPEGLTFSNMFRVTEVPWDAVERFFVVSLKQTGMTVHTMIGFDYAPSYDRSRLGRRLSSAVAGCDGALPDTYGEEPEALAELLNQCLRDFRGRKDDG